jgi:hypothetical protein
MKLAQATFSPRAATLSLLLAAAVLGGTAAPAATATNYATSFEATDGFTAGLALAGNGGWDGQVEDTVTNGPATGGGNGILNGAFPGLGQQAYVGMTPLGGDFAWLEAWRAVPITTAAFVRFSVRMEIVDSSNGLRDDFHWEAFNTNGYLLCALDFDNYNRVVWFRSSASSNRLFQTVPNFHFQRGTACALEVLFDFAGNRWSATWNVAPLVGPLPMVDPGIGLNLGRVEAVWDASASVYGAGYPGDNYMVFDNLLVTSGLPSQPTLKVLAARPGGPATLRVSGEEGARFAVDASTNLVSPTNWSAVGTNVVSGGFFDLADAGAAGLTTRWYRARWVP